MVWYHREGRRAGQPDRSARNIVQLRRDRVLDFLLASGEVSKARAALRRWNRENPDRIVAWEWVEEAVIAKIRADALVHRRPNDALEHLQRHREFTRRLPGDLVDLLFDPMK
jgi:hypothetical protein